MNKKSILKILKPFWFFIKVRCEPNFKDTTYEDVCVMRETNMLQLNKLRHETHAPYELLDNWANDGIIQ